MGLKQAYGSRVDSRALMRRAQAGNLALFARSMDRASQTVARSAQTPNHPKNRIAVPLCVDKAFEQH